MHGKKCCSPAMMAYWLMIVGGLNWGLVGLGGFLGTNLNPVNLLVGSRPTVEGLAYLLVGVATLVTLVGCKCKVCKGGSCESDGSCSDGCCGGGCGHCEHGHDHGHGASDSHSNM